MSLSGSAIHGFTAEEMNKPRVLVVDDTPENIHILVSFLRQTCELIAATTGQKALDYARSQKHRPDLILLDVVMPKMSGYQVCECLKSDPATADIPIIFVSGMSDEDDETRGFKLGACDYITKPFRAAVVRARVGHQLELKLHREASKDLVPPPQRSVPLSLLESVLSRSLRTLFLRCDSRGLILACSPAFSEALGLERQPPGRDLWQTLDALQARPLREALAERSDGVSLFSWKLPNREALSFQIAADSEGFLLLGEQLDQQVLEDVSNRWLSHEVARLKTEFLANLSHEIRSPLNAISGMAHLLSETALDQRQWSYLRDLEKGVGELRKVVADVVDFSDTDLARLDLRSEQFKLSSLVEGVFLQLAAQARQKEVELVSATGSDVPPLIWGDSLRLGQLLFALLENGVKFAAGGRVSLSIEVLDDEHLQFKILDSGIGMTQEQVVNLLGSHAVPNAGLGIPLSRRIVERMGGRLLLESQPGQGSLITIALPCLRAPEAAHPATVVRRGGPGRKILLVEDSEVNQRIVVEMLAQARVEAEVAGNGRVAVDRVLQCGQEIPWRLILMDLQMPEMDGYAATRRIRQDRRFDEVPILAMSSHVLGEERDRCREAGMDGFVFKPVDRESWFMTMSPWLPLEGSLEDRPFPRLTRVNTAFGVRACGGNQQFYRSLLLDFGERCSNASWELEAATAAHDQSRVRFLLHSLHGVAANLGAEELARQCQSLQKNSQPPSEQSLSALGLELRLLAESLAAELAPAGVEVPAGDWTPERIQATRTAMAALGRFLEQGLGDSLDSVQDLISLAEPLKGKLDRLERLVNQFNFSAALVELGELESLVPVM